jgi:hypothetical protein
MYKTFNISLKKHKIFKFCSHLISKASIKLRSTA